MQKISNRLFLLFVLMSFVFGLFGLTSCSEGNKESLKLSFEQNEYQLEVGEQIEISPITKNAGEEPLNFVWKSYNASVVSVNDGVLEGIGIGKTEVKVYVSGKKNVFATVTVKVTAKDQKPVAKFDEVPGTLYVGDELQLTYELANTENECEFVYQSLTDAAVVDQAGLIKVLEEGYGLITVKVTDKVTGQYVSYNFLFTVLTNYDITYVLDEGTNSEENPSFYIADQKNVVLKNPTKTGYIFKGWYEDEEFTKPISVIDVDRKENITLYAKWEIAIYTIEYNENEGTMPKNNVKYEYQYGIITELPRPRLEGYKFVGWYENENFDGESLFEIDDKTTGDKVLYAKYVESIIEVSNELDTSKVYKLGMYQGNKKQTLYMVGTLNGYYGTATQKIVESADVKVVEVEDGYNLKLILADGTVKYADLEVNGTHINLVFNDSPSTIWSYNPQYNTFITKVNSTDYFIGTYNEYTTFSPSDISKIESNFICHLYEEIEYTDEMKANEILNSIDVEEEINTNYQLPIVENLVWNLKEEYSYAELNNNIVSIIRAEKDQEFIAIATYTYNEKTIVTKEYKITILAKLNSSIRNILLNAENLALTKSYSDGAKNISTVLFKYTQLFAEKSGIQMRTKDGLSSRLWNESEVLEIEKIVIEMFKTDYSEEGLIINFGNDINCSDYSVTLSFEKGVLEYVIIPDKKAYKYFEIVHAEEHTAYINSVKIVFEETEEDLANNAFGKINLKEDEIIDLFENYELPKVTDINWSLKETYEAATLNDRIIEVSRLSEDKIIEVIAQYQDSDYKKSYKFNVKQKVSGPEYVEKTYTYTFSASQYTSINQSKTLNGVSWKVTGTGGPYFGYDATKGQQLGSGKKPYTALNLESVEFENVIKVTINTSGASKTNAKLKVFVGGTLIGNQISLTSTAKSYDFTASQMLSGTIKFAFTQTSQKAIYIKTITVVYKELVE